MSRQLSDRRKTKELKVLELHDKGFSSKQIAAIVHMSLRDVIKYIHRVSNKTKSLSTTSVMDEVILEYRVNGLKCEVRDLKMERDNLMNEVNDLRARKYNLQNQVRAKQSELDVVQRDSESERFEKEILKDIFTEDQYHIL